MKPAYFGQCSCCLNIDKNNYPEETELDTNPNSNPNPIHWRAYFGHFTSSRCYYTTILIFMYMNSPKNPGRDPESRSEIDLRRKITIAWNWCLENKYDGNRSYRKLVAIIATLRWASCGPGTGLQAHPLKSQYIFASSQEISIYDRILPWITRKLRIW